MLLYNSHTMTARHVSILLATFGVILVAVTGIRLYMQAANLELISPAAEYEETQRQRLEASEFSFDHLKTRIPSASKINLEEVLDEEDAFISYLFSFHTAGKKVTGQLNVPQVATPSAGFPTIMMLRGFVDPAIYETGIGTRNAAAVFARNGFVTIAPDFLGYGGSDNPHAQPIMARLQRPVTVLDLMASLTTFDLANTSNMMLWGHSNGGQVALSVLEITSRPIPTSLWAPVSKGFPYSILYYTDEYPDGGKALRKVLAEFEEFNDVLHFSIDQYFDWIEAPMQIHQGGNDEAIPMEWTNDLVDTLEDSQVSVTYYTYPTADHNMRPDWNTVVQRDLRFYSNYIDK